RGRGAGLGTAADPLARKQAASAAGRLSDRAGRIGIVAGGPVATTDHLHVRPADRGGMVVILGSRHSDLGRSMKALLAGELSARGRAALIGRIRTDDQARANYERIIEGLRELEQRPIARTELALVENWVIDQVVPVSA